MSGSSVHAISVNEIPSDPRFHLSNMCIVVIESSRSIVRVFGRAAAGDVQWYCLHDSSLTASRRFYLLTWQCLFCIYQARAQE